MSVSTRRGTLVLVVGPSGVGKDSIIARAADILHSEPRIVFARRLITRPQESGGEQHIAVSPGEFTQARDARRLLLHWHAHDLDYGLPAELGAQLDAGSCVVANASRGVVTEAREQLAPVLAVAITAPPDVVAARLAARGREDAAGIAMRLGRADAWPADQADLTITNDGPLTNAIERFVALLRVVIDQPASG
jgi:phosphonate metabolism protein PhnN/1,5-bisphosphokinase (PRPP-forming)